MFTFFKSDFFLKNHRDAFKKEKQEQEKMAIDVKGNVNRAEYKITPRLPPSSSFLRLKILFFGLKSI